MPTPDAPRDHLLALFTQCRAAVRAFAANRSAHERPAQDLLALIGYWMDYNVERLGYFARGELPPRDVDFDALTQTALAINAHRTWGGSLAYAELGFERLAAAVASSPDAILQATNTYGEDVGGPAWGEARANGFIWPMREMEKYYLAHDEPALAAALRAELTAEPGEETPISVALAPPESNGEQLGDLLVIDVRAASEYAKGHLPGARNIPLASLPAHLGDLPRERRIITYCDMHHHGHARGEQAAALLTEAGYRASALAGGLTAWREQGRPSYATKHSASCSAATGIPLAAILSFGLTPCFGQTSSPSRARSP